MTRAICCKQSSITNQLIALADRGPNLPMIIRPFASERCNTATCCRNGETNLITSVLLLLMPTLFKTPMWTSKLTYTLFFFVWGVMYLCLSWILATCIYGHFLWLNVNVHGVGCRRESSKKDSDVRLRSIITIKNISAWIWLAPDWLKPLLGMIKYSCLNSIFESVYLGLKHRSLA